jgi:hypothetical protein
MKTGRTHTPFIGQSLAFGLGRRFAHLGRHEGGQFIGAAEDDLVSLTEDVRSCAGRGFAPGGLCFPCRLDRPDGVFGGAVSYVGGDFTGGRVLDRESLSGG